MLINRRFYSGPQTAFNQKDIKLQFSEKFGEATDPSVVSRAFKAYQDSQFIKPLIADGTKKSKNQDKRQNSYNPSSYFLLLKEIVLKQGPRQVVFNQLKKSGIILKHLVLCNYTWRILRRDMSVDEMVDVLKSKGPD